ncbi:procathepsin L isoform X2 [Drosophila subpulchrella]|uniref:procathepsin L isoform X2 n=1 Tax=Drosophila subpulchrella TaxID=1486046 RepID=UPI0018A12B6D|nr:procathepsin L isoform X2 [Drosophila subpulchrella]
MWKLIIFNCILGLNYQIVTTNLSEGNSSALDYKSEFEKFKNNNNRKYLRDYDEMRSFRAFEENYKVIEEHNQHYKEGQKSFRLKPNIFADMSTDGYLKGFLRLLKSNVEESANNVAEIVGSPLMTNLPESLDWRDKGFITPPYNQQTCGSCYAFSIAESIGGQVFKRTGKVLSLRCVGGSLRNTLIYLQSTGGIMRDDDYKYVAKKGHCQFVPDLSVVNVTSWAILPVHDEQAIQAAVTHIGPVAISINATPKTFQLYSDGIYDDALCSSASVNHAMLVVGFGKDYWILKNWWGDRWGESGFMRIRKGVNMCGIANYAAYAVV